MIKFWEPSYHLHTSKQNPWTCTPVTPSNKSTNFISATILVIIAYLQHYLSKHIIHPKWTTCNYNMYLLCVQSRFLQIQLHWVYYYKPTKINRTSKQHTYVVSLKFRSFHGQVWKACYILIPDSLVMTTAYMYEWSNMNCHYLKAHRNKFYYCCICIVKSTYFE